MTDQAQVRVFDPPTTIPHGRAANQPARVEAFPGPHLEAEHGPELLELPDGSEVAPESIPDPAPRKRTSRKANP